MDSNQLLRSFRRALHTSRLYPIDGPVRGDTIRELHRVLAEGIGLRGDGLSISFLDEGAYVDGRLASPEGQTAGSALARSIFEQGVRELRFLPGLSPDELARLIDPLSRAIHGHLNPVDEDLSVLLWEADLRHIGYQLYEEQTPAEPSEPEVDAAFLIGPAYDDYVNPELAIGGTEFNDLLTRLGEDEKMGLLVSYRQEEEEEIPRKFGLLVLELLRQETDPEACPRLVQTLLEFLRALAHRGRFHHLAFFRAAVDPDRALGALERTSLETTSAWFRSPEFLYPLVDRACSSAQDQAAVLRLLSELPAVVLPDLLAHVLKTGPAPYGSPATLLLARLPREASVRLACFQDTRAEIRQAALEAAAGPEVVGSHGGEGAEEALYVREYLRDPDSRLRCTAVLALERMRSIGASSALCDALHDGESSVRLCAVRALGRRGDRAALDALLQVILSRDFDLRSPEEKQAIFLTAGQVAPAEFWPVLARTAERRALLTGRGGRRRADAALTALSLLGPSARTFLEGRWRRKRPDLLRRLDAA
jgi:hypothetical protein